MKKYMFIAMLAAALIALAACAAPVSPTPAPTAAPVAAPTATTQAAAPKPPANRGAWVDEIVFFEEPDQAKAVSIMEAGDAQLYGLGISDAKVFAKIKDSKTLGYDLAYGSTSELTFNPSVLKDATKLNPFSSAPMREAMNWLVDRNYIAKEIYAGLAIPMWTQINPVFPDYATIADTEKGIEIKYSYDQKKAQAQITDEMKKLGADLTGGKWMYKGSPVTIVFLIRTEDERRIVGDYVSKQLEDLGFTVDRQYKTAAEASPLWVSSDPTDGKWTMYTGGWANTAINRDSASNFDYYYTSRGATDTLWQAYKPLPDFDKVSDILAQGKYKDIPERTQLLAQAAQLSVKDSVRVWLVNRVNVWTHAKSISISNDLAAGPVSGLWPFVIQLGGKPGGQVKFAQPSMLTQPWNVVAGSNFLYDNTINRATRNPATLPDPFTGLNLPQLISSSELTVQQGIPVRKTLDWVTVKSAATIEVPKDAWADWDAENQKFITAGERFTQTATAKLKVSITFDKDMFKTKWHDGSNLSLGDFVLSFIMGFDRAKEKSPIYDDSTVSAFKTFMQTFKGARIMQKDPLIVEIYTDQTQLDAESIVASASSAFFPLYRQGNAPWHTLALGIQADANKELAFGTSKATKLKVEWMSYIAGPSLPIFEKYLNQSVSKPFIPYDKVLSQYITADEASSRYKAASAFYKSYGHLWIGNGPFFLSSVKPTEKIVTIRKFADFTDASEKWAGFAQPKSPVVALSGPTRVTVGQAADFSVKVTFQNQPYAAKDIDAVKFLVVDATGNLAFSADAKSVKDGEWTATITADQSSKLAAGSNQLNVIVVSKLVAIPASESLSFVTIK